MKNIYLRIKKRIISLLYKEMNGDIPFSFMYTKIRTDGVYEKQEIPGGGRWLAEFDLGKYHYLIFEDKQ